MLDLLAHVISNQISISEDNVEKLDYIMPETQQQTVLPVPEQQSLVTRMDRYTRHCGGWFLSAEATSDTCSVDQRNGKERKWQR